MIREFPEWTVSEMEEWEGCVIPQRRFQWTAKNGSARARLLYYGSDAGLITAVEVDQWKFALIVAVAQANVCPYFNLIEVT